MLIEQSLRFAFKANNNQAEYEALIAGILLAKEMGAKALMAKSDSLLITGQVTGEFQAKDPQMAAYLEYVQELRSSFALFEVVHVLREQNARADLLAKLASSGKGAGKDCYTRNSKDTSGVHNRPLGSSSLQVNGRDSKESSIVNSGNLESAES